MTVAGVSLARRGILWLEGKIMPAGQRLGCEFVKNIVLLKVAKRLKLGLCPIQKCMRFRPQDDRRGLPSSPNYVNPRSADWIPKSNLLQHLSYWLSPPWGHFAALDAIDQRATAQDLESDTNGHCPCEADGQ